MASGIMVLFHLVLAGLISWGSSVIGLNWIATFASYFVAIYALTIHSLLDLLKELEYNRKDFLAKLDEKLKEKA